MPIEGDDLEGARAVLSSGRFDELLGSLESETLEAKSEPWNHLASVQDKFELAKDVSSFANLRGGIIVVGAATRRSAIHQREEIHDVSGLPISLSNIDRYVQVISEWVYPAPAGLDVRWCPSAEDNQKGLIAIDIPNQAEHLRSFLVAHYWSETGKKASAVFALVQRLSAITVSTHLEELQSLLREGRRMDAIHQKLDAIIARLESTATNK